MAAPANPKVYHIVHVDKLMDIATDGYLFSDAVLAQHPPKGTVIGMNNIKARRMTELTLDSCGSAWKRDPGSGVIGVEKGPLIPLV